MSIEIRYDDRRLQQLLNRLRGQADNLEPAMREIAGHLVDSVAESFAGQSAPDGSAWKPLADSTIRDRLRRGYSAGPILERSGDLASRILADWDDEVAVAGTNLIYAATHHYGDQKRGIPARPFLGVSDEARAGRHSHAARSPGGAARCRVTSAMCPRSSATGAAHTQGPITRIRTRESPQRRPVNDPQPLREPHRKAANGRAPCCPTSWCCLVIMRIIRAGHMETGFWTAAFQHLGRREPKTPMSFYLRFLWVIAVGLASPFYSDINATAKVVFIALFFTLGVGVLVWVGVLNWCRPENLLYGAEKHFEKWKMAYGTEQGEAGKEDLTTASGNPAG